MDERSTTGLTRYLPHVAAATLLVAICPIAVAWGLRSVGVIHSAILAAVLSMGLALGASYVGGLLWSLRAGSGDLLFSELIVWGWLRRVWIERRLSNALRLLEDEDAAEDIDRERRAVLLAQLAMDLEARDPYTHGHSRRVARHAATIAKRMGLSREQVSTVRAAAVVHDVGKMVTPNSVLRKPGDLTAAEFELIKEHSMLGAQMVAKLGNQELTAMVLHHHERLDGSGYPDGLSGSEIPLGARIIAVADTFDAITSTRPYRPARTHRTAIAILNSQAGSRLDADAVRLFQSHYSGRRPLAAWVALTSVPERLFSWVAGGFNAATGSAVPVIAASALTGAAATTVFDSQPAPTPRPASGHNRTAPGGASHAGLLAAPFSLALESNSTIHIATQGRAPRVQVSLVAGQQLPALGPGLVQAIGATGAIVAPPAGAPSRGQDPSLATGNAGRGGWSLGPGRGGQGTGTGRVLGVPGGGPSGGAGGGVQSPADGGGRTQGSPGSGDGTQGAGGQGAPGDGQISVPGSDQTGATGAGQPAPVDGQTTTTSDGQTTTSDGQTTTTSDGQTTTTTSDGQTTSGGPATTGDSQTQAPGAAQAQPPADGQTTAPGDSTTPTS